jgi:hypothetical protein
LFLQFASKRLAWLYVFNTLMILSCHECYADMYAMYAPWMCSC